MRLVAARTLRSLADQYLPDLPWSSQHVARDNAARASATLRARRLERDNVDSYLRAWFGEDA